MDLNFQSDIAFPPLRPAAKTNDQDETVSGSLAPPRQIEEHEVEMYKEQDVHSLALALIARCSREKLIFLRKPHLPFG